MKKKLNTLFIILLTIICSSVNAQFHPQVPNNLPQHPQQQQPNLPKFEAKQPDLQFVSVNVISVTERTDLHMFDIRLSITYKNAGNAATPTRFALDLQNRFQARAGGYNYQAVGVPCSLHVMADGEERTEEWLFQKDVTTLGRGTREFIIRMDSQNNVAESNETNNNSPVFAIDLP